MADKLTAPLQESILALLATDDRHGRIAAGMLTAEQFNDTYQDFARRVIAYHRKHGKAPGSGHLDDLVDDILGNDKHKLHLSTVRIIEGVLSQAGSLNGGYLIGRVGDFAKRQRFKSAITEASEVYVQGEDSTDAVEQIFVKAIRTRSEDMDAGVRLNNKKKALTFLDYVSNDFSTGVPMFDNNNIGLHYGQILMLIGGKATGKSWWCTDLGKRCLMQGAKVVHYTLENPWQQTVGRYYQSFFAIPNKKDEKHAIPRLKLDKLGRMVNFLSEEFEPKTTLDHKGVRRHLSKKIDEWGATLGNLVVKEFPSGTLTLEMLDAHLDYLEVSENFIPHVMLLDYPDLMNLKGDDKRIALGDTFVRLRGLLSRRRMCGAFPTQGNRSSWDAATVKASMISEDASKVFTSDMVLTYSQTEEEKQIGLARISVPYNRNGRGGFTVIISQHYATGQYVVDSVMMTQNYWDIVPKEKTDDDKY